MRIIFDAMKRVALVKADLEMPDPWKLFLDDMDLRPANTDGCAVFDRAGARDFPVAGHILFRDSGVKVPHPFIIFMDVYPGHRPPEASGL